MLISCPIEARSDSSSGLMKRSLREPSTMAPRSLPWATKGTLIPKASPSRARAWPTGSMRYSAGVQASGPPVGSAFSIMLPLRGRCSTRGRNVGGEAAVRQQGQERVRAPGRFVVQSEGGTHLQTQRVCGGIDGVLEHFAQVERAVHRCGNGVQDLQLARPFAHALLQGLVGLLQLRLGPAPLGQLLPKGGVQPGVVQRDGCQLRKADHLVQLFPLEGRGTGGRVTPMMPVTSLPDLRGTPRTGPSG